MTNPSGDVVGSTIGFVQTVPTPVATTSTVTYTFGSKPWKFCPQCGNELKSEWSYCPGCGEKLNASGYWTYPWYPTYPNYPFWYPNTWGNVNVGGSSLTSSNLNTQGFNGYPGN